MEEHGLSHDEEAAAMEGIVRRQLEMNRLAEEIEMLKGYFKERPENYPAGSVIERGEFVLKVTSNARVDDALAKKVLDPEVYDTISKKTVDTAKARAFLTPEALDKITKKYDNRLTFGLK